MGRSLVQAAVRRRQGLPAVPPPLSCTTLDQDDVDLATEWQRRPDDWHDEDTVETYERRFRTFMGIPSGTAVATMGGRVALAACLEALDLPAGSDVILPGYTCIVVPNAIEAAGLRPVYADIELDAYGLDADSVRARIGPTTGAIMLQHTYGLPGRDTRELLELAADHELPVIEDCAHATGATLDGQRLGTLGDLGFSSSERNKAFNTQQGGMAYTADAELGERLAAWKQAAPLPSTAETSRLLDSVHWSHLKFRHPRRHLTRHQAERRYGATRIESTLSRESQGGAPAFAGMRMPAPLAGLGLNQLAKLDGYNEERRETAQRWRAELDETTEAEGFDVRHPTLAGGSRPAFLRYPALVPPERKRHTSWAVKRLGIRPGHWFKSHLHPSGRRVADCPNADVAVAGCINLPGLVRP